MPLGKSPKSKERKRRPRADKAAAPGAAKTRRGKSATPPPQGAAPRFVVGIGSSAGGLEALRALFSALEPSSLMAYIVVQHLAPLHRSRLVEILSHSTNLRVKEAEDGDRPEAGIIYITPPNADLSINAGALRLSRPQMKIGPKPCIDHFFRSLADNFKEAAIGIILSGTGSDGALGMRAIKAAGGFTLAQSVASAKYDGMPKAARQTGAVDLELDPEGIAAELARFNGMDKLERDHGNELDNDPFDEVLALLYRHNGACFSQYKMSTVRRRVDRRLVATRCQSLEEYLQFLYDHPEEAGNLFQDILISVTAFFRDAESFFKLNEQIEARVRDKPMHGHFRCWVVGCATGEEAYSLAILIQEAIEKFGKRLRLQFFATDLDPLALNIARKGCYPESSFTAFPPFLREKYFQPLQGQFQIKPSLRESIVFARHDITRDAPFLNTDLVSCRNVLIYFNQRLQESVFQTMHYSLLDKGVLFLGRSETVPGTAGALFDTVDKQARIYVCQGGQGNYGRAPLPNLSAFPGRNTLMDLPVSDDNVSPHFLIQALAPDSVILDNDEKVKHLFGRAGEILKFPQGETTTAIRRLLPPPLALELVALIQRMRKANNPVSGRRHSLPQADGDQEVRMRLVPLLPRAPSEMLLTFEITRAETRPSWRTPSELAELPPDERVSKLEEEMSGLREHLQAVTEEHETAHEELQALNEELQSANEELQSSNEELETTNEELQSTNEELTTLNQELNVKSSELAMLYQRYQAVQNAIVYPLLIIDRHQHVLNFNPAARHLLRLGDGDIGTHLKALSTPIDLDDVLAALTPALQRQADTSVAFKARDRSFEVQIQLFRGHREQAEGAVISFVDNTEISSVLNETRLIKGRLASIIDHTPSLVTMKDLSGVYMFANRIFCELTGTAHTDVIGATDDELFGEESAREIRERDYEVLKQNRALQFEESFLLNGEKRFWTSAKFPLLDTNRRPYAVCTISLDISDRVLRQRQLELFKQAIASANSGTVILEDGGEGLRSSFCSAQMSTRFGLEPTSLLELSLEDFFARLHIRAPSGSLQTLLAAVNRQPATIQTLHLLSPGQGELTFEMRSTLMPPREGAGACLILSFFDISQRMLDQRTILAQQEELIRYGRFSTLGEIAAGISHEINTPLNVITTKTDILRRASQLGRLDSARAQSLAEDIDEVVKGISSIVHGLKSAVGIDAGNYERAEVQRLVRDAVKICEFRLQRQGVELRLDLPEKAIMIDCYPVQIMQIIINLLNNSIEAIGGLQERWIHISASEQEGRALVRVQDSGAGIDPNLAEKIMTPFFTTKQDNNGSGIGLSLSRSIARRHQGDLVIDASQANTTFQLELGLASAEEEA